MAPAAQPTTWIVVAESSRARIFSAESLRAPLEELESIAHPEGRLHERELTSDRPGRSFDSAGEGRHAMATEVGPKEKEAIDFATLIVGRVEAGRKEGRFQKLILVAPPRFLGHLRSKLGPEAARMVSAEIDKNLVQLSPADLRDQLPDKL